MTSITSVDNCYSIVNITWLICEVLTPLNSDHHLAGQHPCQSPTSASHWPHRHKCVMLLSIGQGIYIVSVLGLDSGYTVKYNPLPSGVPSGFALRNSFRQRVIFDRISLVSS